MEDMGTIMLNNRAHQSRRAEVIAQIPATSHTSRRALDTHAALPARYGEDSGTTDDGERLGTVGIITQDMRKIIDSAELAFVTTV
jgi:hypothetical protein